MHLQTAVPPLPAEKTCAPKSPQNRRFFLIVFGVALGAVLAPFWGSILDPFGHPSRPKFGPSRLLNCIFFKKSIFKKTSATLHGSTIWTPRRHPRQPKIDPRRLQDDLQEPSFFDFVFDIDFGSSWVPCWLHLVPQRAPKRRAAQDHVVSKTIRNDT